MRRLTTWMMILAILGTSAPAALAAKPKKTPEERFAKLDKDGDKKLSEDEFVNSKKNDDAKTKAGKRFTKLDKDKNGSLSFEEFNVTPKKKAE